MTAKGQSQLIVPVAGLTLGIMLSLIPVFVLDYTVRVSVHNIEGNYDEYESTVYSYRAVSTGENSVASREMLRKLERNDCMIEGVESRKFFLNSEVNGGGNDCVRTTLGTALPIWVENSGMREIFSREVQAG
ncbi:MAG: hypothetical protein ABEJ64_01450 [Candidatus Nanohaloarchaea archaeon]